jgi:hypothetical protein
MNLSSYPVDEESPITRRRSKASVIRELILAGHIGLHALVILCGGNAGPGICSVRCFDAIKSWETRKLFSFRIPPEPLLVISFILLCGLVLGKWNLNFRLVELVRGWQTLSR